MKGHSQQQSPKEKKKKKKDVLQNKLQLSGFEFHTKGNPLSVKFDQTFPQRPWVKGQWYVREKSTFQCKIDKNLETAGIDPATSRMQSERSTI